MDRLELIEYVTPWVRMRADVEHANKWKRIVRASPGPFAPRHSITYYNNKKEEDRTIVTISEYDRFHKHHEDFDPRKVRDDRSNPTLIWSEIDRENKRHIVPMISSHWYGRPNRRQIDYPDKSLCRASQTREFYRRNDLNLIADEIREFQGCLTN